MYRYPKDEADDSAAFYEKGYAEGMTTGTPTDEALATWLGREFRGTEKDLSEKIAVIRRIRDRGRVLDYGCSWGYGVFQFRRAGYEAMGFELSSRRARFGRERLGIEIITGREELTKIREGTFDIVFANHVLEHLCQPREALEDFARLLKSDGVLFIFVPNAGGENAKRLGARWGPMIGEKHPLAIDASFLAVNLPRHGLRPAFAASPYAATRVLCVTDIGSKELAGDELLALARPSGLRGSAGG
jgi:SAM-dependent methyltransferase